ncbi:MAG: DUF1636 domain-containing protein [Methylobacterium sp.]|uniref:DUF1636 domain-containing protein n=1 Tax=Methylobacterium sp. TaxID=409 RepID=UPI0025DC3669|nr:DUF1636 domain-containing protein [Methylobacterium sp.]MBX9931985.1 DUF1636 domain-containing protein [Methylobacterium sp.]
MPEVVLYVCTTCRMGDDASEARAGARLLTALQAVNASDDVRIEGVECLSVCKRPCTVAVASEGRWTYIYGDLDPAASAATILDGLSLYAGTPDGIVPWKARPEAFRKGVVARIPPFPPRAAHPLADAAE